MFAIFLIGLIPLLGGFCLYALPVKNKRILHGFVVGFSVLQLLALVVGFLSYDWSSTVTQTWFVNSWLPLRFSLDVLSAVFLSMVSVLWCLTAFYSVGYLSLDKKIVSLRLFYAHFLLSVFSVVWIALAADLITLFFGYEFLTLLTYPLVAAKGTKEAKKGALVYLLVLLTTSMLFLVGIVLVHVYAGDVLFQTGGVFKNIEELPVWLISVLLGLFLVGVGKAALIPFYFWLPRAMVAPTPVSAFLHAVAVVKSGVFCLLKIGLFIFGFDALKSQFNMQFWIILPSATLLFTGFLAIFQQDLKKRLAYSTVSQLAYITLGWMLFNEIGILGSLSQIVSHAFAKITLFFIVGVLYTHYGVQNLKQLRGVGYQMPVTFFMFSLAALSIVGFPMTIGFWSKFSVLSAVVDQHGVWVLVVLMVGALMAMLYLFEVILVAFSYKNTDSKRPNFSWDRINLYCWIPILISGTLCVVLFFVWPFVLDALENKLFLGQ